MSGPVFDTPRPTGVMGGPWRQRPRRGHRVGPADRRDGRLGGPLVRFGSPHGGMEPRVRVSRGSARRCVRSPSRCGWRLGAQRGSRRSATAVRRRCRTPRRASRGVCQEIGSNGWPHPQVYVDPCGHGVLICSSHGQSSFMQVRPVPATFFDASMSTGFPPPARVMPPMLGGPGRAGPGRAESRRWPLHLLAPRELSSTSTALAGCGI